MTTLTKLFRKLGRITSKATSLLLVLCLSLLLLSGLVPTPVKAAIGDLDPTFDEDGKVTTSFTDSSAAMDVLVQPDGKIVAVGFARNLKVGSQQFAIIRYNTDGSLDLSFGAGGIVLIDFVCFSSATGAILSNGKIIVGGTSCIGTGNSDFALARINSNGSLDTTFGSAGLVTTNIGGMDEMNDIALQADGKIVAAGKTTGALSTDFAVARYDSSGVLDPTFNGTGVVVTSFGAGVNAEANDVVVMPDTTILAAGTATSAGNTNIALARYLANGTPDGSLGGDGTVVEATFQGTGKGLAIQGANILVSGRMDGLYGVARFDNSGVLDGNFGTGGRATIAVDGVAEDVAVLTDKIVIAGHVFDAIKNDEFAVALFDAAGTPDIEFGVGGLVVTPFTNATDRALALAIQADEKIVVAGFSNAGGAGISAFALARYLSRGPIPSGTDTVGLYNPANSDFFLRNTNSSGVADISFSYGPGGLGWVPIVGDWNGDGVDTIGLYSPTQGAFFLRNSNTVGIADIAFSYGPAGLGWIPLAGDWDGDGIDTIGLYNPVNSDFFLRNTNSSGVADVSFSYGPGGLGWVPIVGDWDGDGTNTIGLYDPAASAFFLRNSNTEGVANISFTYGPGGQGWRPLTGDWNNDGLDTIGLYDPANSDFFLRNTNDSGVAVITFSFGPANLGWVPITGDWDGM